jgi:hypothetical protein
MKFYFLGEGGVGELIKILFFSKGGCRAAQLKFYLLARGCRGAA